MFPWLWFWAPQLHLPWSGDVAQEIEPTTSWFFRGIRPGSGDAEIEEKAFAVASYGRQLGLITEVLIDLAEQLAPASPQATEALVRLKQVKDSIDEVKAAECAQRVAEIATQVAALRRGGGADFAALRAALVPLLEAPGGSGTRAG
jgi:hypothetical protein